METSENEYLKELSPKLFDRKVNIPEDAPEGYFEDLPDQVMAAIDGQKELQPQPRKWVNWRNIGIAAGLAIAIGAVQFFKPFQESEQVARVSLSEISTEEMEAYIDENDIYELMETPEANSLSVSAPSDEITDYLLLEGVSEEMIYEAVLNSNSEL